jgi:hypothetical protein
MRRDPVIFPALEEGRVTFTQANELLSAPAVARRSLLDRLYRERPTFDVLRTWVQAARAETRRNQQHVADVAAGGQAANKRGGNRFEPVRVALARLGNPCTPAERDTLGQIVDLVRRLLTETTAGTHSDEVAIYQFGRTVIDGARTEGTQPSLRPNPPRRGRTLAQAG